MVMVKRNQVVFMLKPNQTLTIEVSDEKTVLFVQQFLKALTNYVVQHVSSEEGNYKCCNFLCKRHPVELLTTTMEQCFEEQVPVVFVSCGFVAQAQIPNTHLCLRFCRQEM